MKHGYTICLASPWLDIVQGLPQKSKNTLSSRKTAKNNAYLKHDYLPHTPYKNFIQNAVQKGMSSQSVVAHVYIHSTWAVETGGLLQVLRQPRLHDE